MAKKDVDVRFNLIDNFTASFNKTIQTMTAGTKKAQNAWKSVSKFGDSITGMGTKMSAVVTAPLVGLGAASASEFGNVDKSLKLVQQTMGSTDAQAKTLESAIKSARLIRYSGCRMPRMQRLTSRDRALMRRRRRT